MRRGYTPRILARALRAWLACTILALTCAPPAVASARAPVVMVAEAATERDELPCEQRRAERVRVCVPGGVESRPRPVRQRDVHVRLQAPCTVSLYLEHCALLL